MRPRQGDFVKSSPGSTADVKPGMRTTDRGICRPDCTIELLGSTFVKIQIAVRWMDLESVIQSEVSQKEKNKYHMLTHIYGI